MPWATPPCTWPIGDQRVQQAAGILDDEEAEDADLAGLGIHLDLGDMAGIGEGAARVVGGGLGQVEAAEVGELLGALVDAAGNLGQRDGGLAGPGGAVAKGDGIGLGLQQAGGGAAKAGGELVGGELGGAAGDHRAAAGEASPAIGRAVRIAMDDADAGRVEAEAVGRHLGEGGPQALAMGRGADADLHLAGRGHGDVDHLVAGTMPMPRAAKAGVP
jgi:hypothetical protein